MRALILMSLAACSPSIATGDYLCGDEQSCPPDLVCNGADNTCVIQSLAVPFACDPAAETSEPDQDAAHAASLNTLDCVSLPVVVNGCLAAHDNDDWFTFGTNPGCTSDAINVQLLSAIAFETVTVELYDSAGATKIATADASCENVQSPDTSGSNALCLSHALTPGTSYSLHVTTTGDGTCGGNCAYNRYRLTVQTALH